MKKNEKVKMEPWEVATRNARIELFNYNVNPSIGQRYLQELFCKAGIHNEHFMLFDKNDECFCVICGKPGVMVDL